MSSDVSYEILGFFMLQSFDLQMDKDLQFKTIHSGWFRLFHLFSTKECFQVLSPTAEKGGIVNKAYFVDLNLFYDKSTFFSLLF